MLDCASDPNSPTPAQSAAFVLIEGEAKRQ
jgi:hypothetical protein